jgi:soluble lytic murein transglycosylase
VRAQTFPHGRSAGAADAWGVAIARCEGSDALPQALYYGAKASVSAHRHDEALARFGRVERDFPAHRLADDARLRAAMVVKDEGDDARSLAMLTSLPDTYPQGDMGGEALFRAAIDRIAAHDYPVAAALLDRLLAMPDEAKGCCGGRGPYFRARVAQLSGDAAGARERYAAVVATQPLTFYMMLAAARLRAIDPSAAREALRAAADQEPDAPFLAQDHPELASPSFDRFARLLEVGDLDAARREVAIGKLAADGVDPDVLWTVAWAYDRAGAPDLGHAFSRARLVDFRGHWPAGRWRLPWQVAYPRAWDALVTRESAASGIPAPLTWSIMREESAYNPDAKSGAGAIGLMQLMTGTARQMAAGTPLVVDDASLRRPDVSIPLGARLLSKMRASFQANPALAVAAYNSGSGPVRHWLDERGTDDFDLFVERIPYEETRNYVKRALTSEVAYAYLYAPGALDELLALPARASG